MKNSKVLKSLFPNWLADPIDKGIAELLAFDKPKKQAAARLHSAEADYKAKLKDELSRGNELSDTIEPDFKISDLARRLELIDQAFSEKKSEVVKLIADSAKDHRQRLVEVELAIELARREKRTAFFKAVFQFAREWGIDFRSIQPPSQHTGGSFPIPAAVGIPEDRAEWVHLRQEAAATDGPPIFKNDEILTLVEAQARLNQLITLRPDLTVDVLLAENASGA